MKRDCVFFIKDGKITNRKTVAEVFDNLENGRYNLQIAKHNHRTLDQNAYLHCCFTLCQRGLYDIGYRQVKTMEDAKEVLKSMFLKIEQRNEETKSVVTTVKSTASLTKEEMQIFIDEVIQFASEYLGIAIPSPEEYKRSSGKYDLVRPTAYAS